MMELVSAISSVSSIIITLIAAWFGCRGLRAWVYQQQYEDKCKAAHCLNVLIEKIANNASRPAPVPEMSSEDISKKFSEHAKEIGDFLLEHVVVLPPSVADLLREAQGVAYQGIEGVASINGKPVGYEFFDLIRQAGDRLIMDVQLRQWDTTWIRRIFQEMSWNIPRYHRKVSHYLRKMFKRQ